MSAGSSEYHLHDDLDLTAAQLALPGRLRLAADPARSVERTYYDTFDGRLHGRGLTLVWQDRRLSLVDGELIELASTPLDAPPDRLPAEALPPSRLRDLVEPIIELRTLLPLVRTRSAVHGLRALNPDDKTVVRIAVEEPAIVGDGVPARTLPRRLRLVPVRGYDKELARVRRALEHSLDLAAVDESLADEAVASIGATPGGVSAKLDVELDPAERADAATATILVRLLATIEQNLPGTLEDLDTEFLHDLRVAVRRTRTAQRQLKRVFPAEPLARFREEFRSLQRITGPTRDLDVHLLELDEFDALLPEASRADLAPLRPLLLAHRDRERRRMETALRAERTRKLLTDWAAFLDRLVDEPVTDRPRAVRPISAVAGRRIARVYRGMVEDGEAIDDSSPPEALHDLRKTGKELRYLLEFFSSLYPPKVVKPMVKTLKALQDVLGRHQDRAVQVELLRSLSDELATAPRGPAALLAVGLLIDRLEHDQAAARSELADRFAAFAARDQQALVRKTFA